MHSEKKLFKVITTIVRTTEEVSEYLAESEKDIENMFNNPGTYNNKVQQMNCLMSKVISDSINKVIEPVN